MARLGAGRDFGRPLPLLPSRMRALLLLPLALLVGCGSDPAPAPGAEPPPKPDDTPAVAATWSLTPDAYRGQNGTRLVFECPPNPGREEAGAVWGTGVYSDDSSLCVAAVHAGVLTFEDGGRVAVTIAPGAASYEASSQHGVDAMEWGAWDGSFTVADA